MRPRRMGGFCAQRYFPFWVKRKHRRSARDARTDGAQGRAAMLPWIGRFLVGVPAPLAAEPASKKCARRQAESRNSRLLCFVQKKAGRYDALFAFSLQ